MELKVKLNGMLIDCNMSLENGCWVATPVTEREKPEHYDPNVGWIIMLNGVPVIRKVFTTRQKAIDYAYRYWKHTKFDFFKVVKDE